LLVWGPCCNFCLIWGPHCNGCLKFTIYVSSNEAVLMIG
jgi:hypothetical protein